MNPPHWKPCEWTGDEKPKCGCSHITQADEAAARRNEAEHSGRIIWRDPEDESLTPGFEIVRTFETGATRDQDSNKPDYEGFLSPLVIRRFGAFMHKHRVQSDGTLRAADNWQRGIPRDAYASSGWRHFLDFWTLHRGYPVEDYDGNSVDIEDALCAILFNASGYLHEILSEETPRSH